MGLITEMRGACLVLQLDFAPVNSLGRELRTALHNELLQASARPEVRAVVIASKRRVFSAGADIDELDDGSAFSFPSYQRDIAPLIHRSKKPIVAAIAGSALGGGLELALACQGRIAHEKAVIGLPEVTLGLLPAGGATHLLPRAVGLERAVNMIVSGKTFLAETFRGLPLFDGYASGDPVDDAVAFANELADRAEALPSLSSLPINHPEPQGFLEFAKMQVAPLAARSPGAIRALEAIAGNLDRRFEDALDAELAAFNALLGNAESRALRHVFKAERDAPKLVDANEEAAPGEIRRAAVVGAGYMGVGIGICLAKAGIPLVLYDLDRAAAEKAVASIQTALGNAAPASVSSTSSMDDLSDSDLVIEAISENLKAKKAVFSALSAVVKPEAVLCSNTSTLDLEAIASSVESPKRFLGLHFFGPAQVMRLVEVVRSTATSAKALSTAIALVKKIKKVPIVVRACEGFVGNRMYLKYLSQAATIAEAGVAPALIDAALEKWGMAMGPFKTMDLIGLDILASGNKPASLAVLDRFVERNWLGRKTGAGWYSYENPRKPLPNKSLREVLPSKAGPDLADDAIVQRCLLALIDEGGRILQEGVAQRASDIDICFVLGYGFPAFKGGPMYQADIQGAAKTEILKKQFSGELGLPKSSESAASPKNRKVG